MDKKRIMVADDEEDFLKAMEIRLQGAGYDVVLVRDGEDLKKECEQEIPDLVVLDVMMPKMNGFEVLRWMKNHEKLKEIPVIYLTAGAFDISQELDILSQAHDFMLKTVDSDKIIERIEKIFG